MSEFTDLLIHTISIAQATGVNNQGEYTYAAAAVVKARVEQARRNVRRPDGSEINASHEIMLETAVYPTTRIWLAGQSTANAKLARTPLEVKSASSIEGDVTLYRILI